MGLCPRSLLVRKKHQDGKVFQVERPDHLEAWVEALELGELDPGTERQVSKNLRKKTFFQVVVGRLSGRSGLASLLLVQSTCFDAPERQGRMVKNKNDILN